MRMRHRGRPNQRSEPATPPNISSSAPPREQARHLLLLLLGRELGAEPLVDLGELLASSIANALPPVALGDLLERRGIGRHRGAAVLPSARLDWIVPVAVPSATV